MSEPDSHPRCARCNKKKEERPSVTLVEIVCIIMIAGFGGYLLLELISLYFDTHRK